MLEELLTTILGNFILTIAFGVIFVFIKFKIIPYFKKPKIIQENKTVKTELQIILENSKINDTIILHNKINPRYYPSIKCILIACNNNYFLLAIMEDVERVEDNKESHIVFLKSKIIVEMVEKAKPSSYWFEFVTYNERKEQQRLQDLETKIQTIQDCNILPKD